MAKIVLGMGTSHAPFLNGGPERWADGGKVRCTRMNSKSLVLWVGE